MQAPRGAVKARTGPRGCNGSTGARPARSAPNASDVEHRRPPRPALMDGEPCGWAQTSAAARAKPQPPNDDAGEREVYRREVKEGDVLPGARDPSSHGLHTPAWPAQVLCYRGRFRGG